LGKFIDLTGQRFGRLVVIKRTGNDKNGRVMWLCRCDCGGERVVLGSYLKNGDVKSCGCYHMSFKDLIGKKFGKLTVISLDHKKKTKNTTKVYWNCICDCGNVKVVEGNSLKTKSCGCIQKEFEDLIGKKFGRLTVISQVDKPSYKKEKKGGVYWKCLCDCGNITITNSHSLKGGSTKSCGCLRNENHTKKVALSIGESAFNRLFYTYKKNAINRNLKFDISKDKFRQYSKGNCFYCGEPPSQVCASGCKTGNYIYNGIDRVDSLIGYEVDNVVSCCGTCNVMKMAMGQQEFLDHIGKIYNYQKEKNDRN
jgi:hypothetical protein